MFFLQIEGKFLKGKYDYSRFTNTQAYNLGYIASTEENIHGCQIVHRDPLNAKRNCPQKHFGMGYVKMHGF